MEPGNSFVNTPATAAYRSIWKIWANPQGLTMQPRMPQLTTVPQCPLVATDTRSWCSDSNDACKMFAFCFPTYEWGGTKEDGCQQTRLLDNKKINQSKRYKEISHRTHLHWCMFISSQNSKYFQTPHFLLSFFKHCQTSFYPSTERTIIIIIMIKKNCSDTCNIKFK